MGLEEKHNPNIQVPRKHLPCTDLDICTFSCLTFRIRRREGAETVTVCLLIKSPCSCEYVPDTENTKVESYVPFLIHRPVMFSSKTQNKSIHFKAHGFHKVFYSLSQCSLPSVSSLPPSPSCCHTASRAPYLLTTFTFMIPTGNGIQLVWITELGYD